MVGENDNEQALDIYNLTYCCFVFLAEFQAQSKFHIIKRL